MSDASDRVRVVKGPITRLPKGEWSRDDAVSLDGQVIGTVSHYNRLYGYHQVGRGTVPIYRREVTTVYLYHRRPGIDLEWLVQRHLAGAPATKGGG